MLVDARSLPERELCAAAAGVEHDQRVAGKPSPPSLQGRPGDLPLRLGSPRSKRPCASGSPRRSMRCCGRFAGRPCPRRQLRARRCASPPRPCPRSRSRSVRLPRDPISPRLSRPSPRRVISARSTSCARYRRRYVRRRETSSNSCLRRSPRSARALHPGGHASRVDSSY